MLPSQLAFEADGETWEHYLHTFATMRGIVEAWITGSEACSPSVQLRVTPLATLEAISTHDQVLAGATGELRIPSAEHRCYYATDNFQSPALKRLIPDDLHFDQNSMEGVTFNLIGALAEFGKPGVFDGSQQLTMQLLVLAGIGIALREHKHGFQIAQPDQQQRMDALGRHDGCRLLNRVIDDRHVMQRIGRYLGTYHNGI